MRPRQWIKNSIVFFALIFDKQLLNLDAFLHTLMGFALFSLVASTVYIFNDIADIEADRQHPKKKDRPLPSARMNVGEAWIISSLSGIIGIALLWFMVNPLTSTLAALSLFIYVVLYTPLKRVSSFSVFVGAFPGAIPPMLGFVAATGTFGLEAGLLFAIQFMWQFPHFWAIAWNVNDDYNKAGFYLLPSKQGKTEFSAFIILMHSLMLLPVSMLPYFFGITGISMTMVILALGIYFAMPAFKLFFKMKDADARKLMFASFLYLPLALMAFFIDKFI